MVAQSQDRLGLTLAGQAGRDVAELPAVGHDRLAEVGPALGDVGGDPRGDGGAGLWAGAIGHCRMMVAHRHRAAWGRSACRTDPWRVGPYVRAVILPGSWAGVLEPCRPVFRRRGTFVVFTVLYIGLVTLRYGLALLEEAAEEARDG